MSKSKVKSANTGVDEADEQRAMRRRSPGDEQLAQTFAIEAARLATDLHCTDVLVLDTRGVSQITDFIVIGSGTSDRQIRSVGEDVADLAKEHGFSRYGSEQDPRSTWLVLDFVDVIVHLFEPVTRAHYDLEMMWGDAPRVAWRRQK